MLAKTTMSRDSVLIIFNFQQKTTHQPIRLTIIIITIAIYVFFFTLPAWNSSAHIISGSRLPPRPLISAHRGLSREAPENTVPAFLKAAELYVIIKIIK